MSRISRIEEVWSMCCTLNAFLLCVNRPPLCNRLWRWYKGPLNSKIKLFVGHKIYKCPFETGAGTAILWYLEYQRVHCHITPRFRKDMDHVWSCYFFCRCSALLGSKSKQRSEAFDGEWQNGMKGSIFDQAELWAVAKSLTKPVSGCCQVSFIPELPFASWSQVLLVHVLWGED